MRNRLKFANIPDGFKDMTLKTFRTDLYRLKESKEVITFAVRIIKAYLEEFESEKANGMGLYIYSDSKGSGKTRIVASLANELMKNHNTPVKFAVMTSILSEIKATWRKQKQNQYVGEDNLYTESQLLDALVTVEVLIIDDLGVEIGKDEVKDWINERIFTIIDGRYRNKKPTIITSNYALADLRHDTRITNRIKERVYEIPFPEESVRDYLSEQNNAAMFEKIRRN
jgi:DNA replication protein DnaC